MLTRIESGAAYGRFLAEYNDHNDRCPWETHPRQRTARDGSKYTQQVPRQVGTLPQSLMHTFYILLSEYVYSYNNTAATMPAGMYTIADPPSMHTNSVRLGKVCNVSSRTVRNHLTRLRSLGVIGTKFHGHTKNYELWINPEVLFGEEVEKFQKGPETSLSEGVSKIFPHTNTHRELTVKEKRGKDKSFVYGENDYGERGRTDQAGDAAATALPSEGVAYQKGRDGGGGRAEIVAQNDELRLSHAKAMMESRTPRPPRGLDPRFLNFLVEFWLYAWKVVYPSREFTKTEQEQALVAIAAGVYHDFQDVRSDKEWVEFQVFQLSKLDKAGRYYDNHPDAYRPDPYAVYVPGKGYFDAANLKGFVGIEAWMKRDSLKKAKNRHDYAEARDKKEKRCEALLRTARRDFEKQRANLPPRKDMIGKNQIAIFQYYHVIFQGQGKKWEKAFAKQYLDQQGRDFSPPKYAQARNRRRQAGETSAATVIYVEDYMTYGEGFYS